MARVLIVDPEPDLRLLAADAVAELGHEAVVFEELGPPASADVLMIAPCRDMQAVVEQMRASYRGLSVILVSVVPPGADTEALHPEGFLAKPYTLKALSDVLELALSNKEAV